MKYRVHYYVYNTSWGDRDEVWEASGKEAIEEHFRESVNESLRWVESCPQNLHASRTID